MLNKHHICIEKDNYFLYHYILISHLYIILYIYIYTFFIAVLWKSYYKYIFLKKWI